MNLDPHWLKERYKDYTNDELNDRFRYLDMFGDDDKELGMIVQEAKRREREAHDHQSQLPLI
jgi:hypothetical protein